MIIVSSIINLLRDKIPEFYQFPGETNVTYIRILNDGQEEGWDNLSLSFDDDIDNVTFYHYICRNFIVKSKCMPISIIFSRGDGGVQDG